MYVCSQSVLQVHAKAGVSIKQALKKAMHHRNLTTAESLVSVSQKDKPKMFLDWNTDTTLLCGQEVCVCVCVCV